MNERIDTLKKNKFKILTIILMMSFTFYFYSSIKNIQLVSNQEKFEILSEAIIRSAVQCYAVEGFYPPSIKYLEDNYGLIVDHDKFVVMYSVFASNIMPDVEVYFK